MTTPYGTAPQVYDGQSRRRLTQIILFVIIIATLPCYVIGAVLLAVAPQDDDTAGDIIPTTLAPLSTAQSSPTNGSTPIQAFTALPTTTLQSTPGQFIAPTRQRFTNTPLPSVTTAPSVTSAPSITPSWTFTFIPPTATFTSIPPTATLTTEPPTATTEPPTATTVPPTATITTEPPTITLAPSFTVEPPTPTQEGGGDTGGTTG